MLAILATHPIQYQIPVWKGLADRGNVPFEVWYLTKHGVEPSVDAQFGRVIRWDLDLLGGYPYRFSADEPRSELGGFWDMRLPVDFRRRVASGSVKALLIHGWNVRACWDAVYCAARAGVPVWIRGESNDLKVDRGPRKIAKRFLLKRFLSRVERFLYVGQSNRSDLAQQKWTLDYAAI